MGHYANIASELRDRLRDRGRRDGQVSERVRAAVQARGGRATLMHFEPAVALDEWHEGGYPYRFLEFAHRTLGVVDPAKVLHVCSGGVRVGITLDIRAACRPRVVGDARSLPFRDASFDFVMADPPYGESYAEHLYGTGNVYPRPATIMLEAARVLRPGGRFGLLHFITPRARGGLRLLRVWGLWVGPDMAIRAWSIWEKEQPRLIAGDVTSAPPAGGIA